jgi:hypothetical protein
VVSLRPLNPNFANDYLEYLIKYEAICEMALAISGDCLMKKTKGPNSHDTVPLTGDQKICFGGPSLV